MISRSSLTPASSTFTPVLSIPPSPQYPSEWGHQYQAMPIHPPCSTSPQTHLQVICGQPTLTPATILLSPVTVQPTQGWVPQPPTQIPPTACTDPLSFPRGHPVSDALPNDTPTWLPWDTGSPALGTDCQPHFSEVTGSTHSAPRGFLLLLPQDQSTSLSPLLYPRPSPPTLEEDERNSGEGPGPGQEGRVPVGRPPVCPRLILAAFSLAWRSGPVAPAVILRFLGHRHAGSAAKWGAGGVGAASRAKGREGDACGRVAGTGVCTKAAGALGGVSSLLPACLGQCGAADLDRWSPEGLGFLV